MNFFDHKNLGNHLLQLCPKVVKHPVYKAGSGRYYKLILANLDPPFCDRKGNPRIYKTKKLERSKLDTD